MPDDDRVSIGELGRRIDHGFADLKEDIRDLSGRLDSKVDVRTHEDLVRRVAQLESDRKRDDDRRAADRRSLFTSLVAPIVVAVVLAIGSVVIAMYVALAKGT